MGSVYLNALYIIFNWDNFIHLKMRIQGKFCSVQLRIYRKLNISICLRHKLESSLILWMFIAAQCCAYFYYDFKFCLLSSHITPARNFTFPHKKHIQGLHNFTIFVLWQQRMEVGSQGSRLDLLIFYSIYKSFESKLLIVVEFLITFLFWIGLSSIYE